jgi:hypothetical protein
MLTHPPDLIPGVSESDIVSRVRSFLQESAELSLRAFARFVAAKQPLAVA